MRAFTISGAVLLVMAFAMAANPNYAEHVHGILVNRLQRPK